MSLDRETCAGLGVALNEATLLSFELFSEKRTVTTSLAVLSLPEQGPEPSDPRILLRLSPVGRLRASLRRGHWNDETAEVLPVAADQLTSLVTSLGQQAIYGWEFFDTDEAIPDEKLSLSWQSSPGGLSHTLYLFQEYGSERFLEIVTWFDELTVFGPDYTVLPIEEFIAGARRWWEANRAGDPRTMGHGIVPLSENDA